MTCRRVGGMEEEVVDCTVASLTTAPGEVVQEDMEVCGGVGASGGDGQHRFSRCDNLSFVLVLITVLTLSDGISAHCMLSCMGDSQSSHTSV